ncbi:MAG TPA: hypothetical protein EYH31_06465, partial [Anaerolineae bacterium]|nr:hypothetical protein [Anaerolineae bacterium]
DQVLAYNNGVPIAYETYKYMLCTNTFAYWAILSAADKRADYIRINSDVMVPDAGYVNPSWNYTPEPDYERLNQEVMDWARQFLGKAASNTPFIWVAMREHRNPWIACQGREDSSYYPQLGNYDFYLEQDDSVGDPSKNTGGKTVPETNDPNVTGLGACGPGAQPGDYGCNTNPYNPAIPPGREGWVVRRTDEAHGSPNMWFKVDNGFINGGTNQVTIAVIYADVGTDTWELRYDSTGGEKPAIPDGSTREYVEKTGSNTWKVATFTINDARFANSLLGFSDFRINSRMDGDEWIHMVIVRKGTGYTGPPPTFTPTPSPTPTNTPTATPTNTPTPTPQPQAGHIGGYVFEDQNDNHLRDDGEPGLGGAIVELRQGPNAVGDTTTSPDGHYAFTDLAPGLYTVVQTGNPPGYHVEPGYERDSAFVQAGQTFTLNFPNKPDPTATPTVTPTATSSPTATPSPTPETQWIYLPAILRH